jgi:hypothetical protein
MSQHQQSNVAPSTATKTEAMAETSGDVVNTSASQVSTPVAFDSGRADYYAQVLGTLYGYGPDVPKAKVVDWVRQQVGQLSYGAPSAQIELLAGQCLTLEALALVYTERANAPGIKPEASVALAKIALSAQQAYVKTLGAIVTLRSKKPHDGGDEMDGGMVSAHG